VGSRRKQIVPLLGVVVLGAAVMTDGKLVLTSSDWGIVYSLTYIDDLPPPLYYFGCLAWVRELLAQAEHGTVVGLVNVGAMERSSDSSVIVADAMPVRGPAADLVAERDDPCSAGSSGGQPASLGS
jgi:hypothetical protein